VPHRGGKFGEVDIVAAPRILHERRIGDFDRFARRQALASCHPRLQGVERPQQRVDAERERRPLRARHDVRHDAQAGRITLDGIEQQRRTIRHAGRHLGDGADLMMRVGARDAPQRAEGVDLGDEFT